MAEWKITPQNETTIYDVLFYFRPDNPAETHTLFVGDLIAGNTIHFAYSYRQQVQRSGALEFITVAVPESRTFDYDVLKKVHALKYLDVNVSTIIQDFRFEEHPIIARRKYKNVFFYPYILEVPRARNFFFRVRRVVKEGTKLMLTTTKSEALVEVQKIARLAGFRLCEEILFSEHLIRFYGKTFVDYDSAERDKNGSVTQIYEFII